MSPFGLDAAAYSGENPDNLAEAVLAGELRADEVEKIPEPLHWSRVLDQVWAQIESGEAPQVIPTPFPGLNELLDGGFRRQELVLIGGLSTAGKTAIVGQFASAAAKTHHPVALVSLEMSVKLAVCRMLVQETRVFATSLRRNTVDDYDKSRIRSALPALRGLPVWVTDEATSIRQVVTMVARWGKQHEGGLVLIDFLQLINAPKTIRDRRLQVEYVSRTLRRLAIQCDVCVVAVSALRRLMKDEVPGMSTLKESGDLEYGADVVIVLSREPDAHETKCIVAKQRNGKTGQIDLIFDGGYTRFQEG